MHVGVIGGGLMGTSLAYFLAQAGQQVTLIEQSAELGGLSGMIQLDDALTIPRYQHYLLPSDMHMLDMIGQLGLGHALRFRPMQAGFVTNGGISPMRSVWDLLRFGSLRLQDRLLLGHTIVQARLTSDWQRLDSISAEDWLVRHGGRANFERIWTPLLDAKFDYEHRHVPATFIWSWLNRMSRGRSAPHFATRVGHLPGGLHTLIDAMGHAVAARGGTIKTQTRVREIDLNLEQAWQVRTHTGMLHFDVVVAAIPSPELNRLLLSADNKYARMLSNSRYLGLVCPAVVVERSLSNYWTLNLTDPSSPFSSIIEMPIPTHPHLRVLYLPKFTSPENDWMGVPDDDIRAAWLLRLRQIFPSLKPDLIRHFAVNRSRYVEPLHFLNAAERLLPVETPWPGLYLANSSQVYPQLPTSDAIINHARMIAESIVLQGQPRSTIRTAA